MVWLKQPEPEDGVCMSKSSPPRKDGPASLGNVFGQMSAAEIKNRLARFNGTVTSHSIDKPGRVSVTDRAIVAASQEIDDEPFAEDEDTGVPADDPLDIFQAAAAVQTQQDDGTPAVLPDLTDAYLNLLIGWHRQKTGLNPRANMQTVWIKDRHDQWQASETESWKSISRAILSRARNVETQASSLFDHIRNLRIEMSAEKLNQLLSWYEEKTGQPHRRNETVWIKTADGKWDTALFRWSDINAEFRHHDVRERMGAQDLQSYKSYRRTAAIDRMVYAAGMKP